MICCLAPRILFNYLAKVESELSLLDPPEKLEFLSSLGVTDENCGLRVYFVMTR
jgi:hypothetical protein